MKNIIDNDIQNYKTTEECFLESIEKFLKLFPDDYVNLTPLLGRVKHKTKFDFSKISMSYRKEISNEVIELKEKINSNQFKKFKEEYHSFTENLSDIINKANSIKDRNPRLNENIGYFLFSNGIILLVKDEPDESFKNLDGFACFLKDNPIIVVYKKNDTRRMLFTICHEIYHLLYDENDKYADKFAGCMLLSHNDTLKLKEMKTATIEESTLLIEELCKKNNISITACLKTLKNYNIITEDEEKFNTSKINKKLKLQEKVVNIYSTNDLINNIK